MNFNVEDIMALPLLKEGTLPKHIKSHDIRHSVSEITSILSWTAVQKGISIDVKFEGFPMIKEGEAMTALDFDEQRVQQVLLNYVSNALKFINKSVGKILILV